MSLLIRRAFNLLNELKVKPLKRCYKNINNYNNNSILLSKRPLIQCLRIQYYSSTPPENASIDEELNENVIQSELNIDLTASDVSSERTQSSANVEKDVNRVKEFWKKHDITVHGKDAPLPVFDFHECEWPQKILEALETDGFESPTPIQSQGWPIALSGRDMVGIAQTGSGKTLCYVLPAFVKIMKERPQRGPKCLVLAPTRELAQQIQAVVRRYRITSNVCLYGGSSRMPQMKILRETNPQIVIATPGRMNDFIESSAVQLNSVNYLVLDEADRMLDMGFEPQIRKIINYIPKERQTLMWSATWPNEVRHLASQYMRDYIQINVGGTQLTANKNIKQHIHICEPYDKLNQLIKIIGQFPQNSRGENKILIFSRTKRTADFLVDKLRGVGRRAMATHSDKSQSQRDFTLGEFRSGQTSILCATDVAARGLDVNDIQVVINYDFPNCTEDYVHRIGRTGRSNNSGIAYTLFTEEDKTHARDLIEVLKDSGQEISADLSNFANQMINTKASKRVWGYEPRNQSFPRQPFRNNRRFDDNNNSQKFNDNYNNQRFNDNYSNQRFNDNHSNQRFNNNRRTNSDSFEDRDQFDDDYEERDNRYAYKKDLRNRNYSNRSRNRDDYDEDI